MLQGTTWFCVPYKENIILFGSSFPSPANLESAKIDDFIYDTPKKLFIDGSRNLPQDVPLSVKIRNFWLKIIYNISVPVHVLYSRYLLESTLKKLLDDRDKDED